MKNVLEDFPRSVLFGIFNYKNSQIILAVCLNTLEGYCIFYLQTKEFCKRCKLLREFDISECGVLHGRTVLPGVTCMRNSECLARQHSPRWELYVCITQNGMPRTTTCSPRRELRVCATQNATPRQHRSTCKSDVCDIKL